jgi:hypothetical protein
VKFADLHVEGTQIPRDLWRQSDLPPAAGSYTATVPAHGVVLISLRKK